MTVDTISFCIIEDKPVPKARAKVTSKGWAYTPAKTKAAEKAVAIKAKEAMKGKKPYKDIPIVMHIMFHMPIPKSWPKKRQQKALQMPFTHISTPDLDNLEKLVMDACNKIVYHDDSQIVSKISSKSYSLIPSTTVAFIIGEEID